MTKAPSVESLARTVMSLLADAAFVFAEPTEAPLPASEGLLVARLIVEQSARWELCLCVQRELGDLLAANLLGTEGETGEASAAAADAVGELANILAGTLAVELFGKDALCHIGIPTVAVESEQAVCARLAESTCRANLLTEEGHAMAVALTLGAFP